jgi:hypothetical protein
MNQPKFKDTLAWRQAELLMQPALIRVIDNIRKQLETSPWQGTYQEIQTPYPGYQLCLTHHTQSVQVDIWKLCFQVCFRDYYPEAIASQAVDIDTSLIDESEEVDWQRLETKAQQVVRQVFADLPVVEN